MLTDKGLNRTAEETGLHMTPMIDVTFLLLIFFMCSIKFKRLDGKLSTYLPKEVGVNASEDIKRELEHIVLYLENDESDSKGFSISWNRTNRKLGLTVLCRLMKSIRIAEPETKAVCHAGEGVLYGHVVTVVNECLRAGIREVEFKGIRLTD